MRSPFSRKILLIDDDPLFARLLARKAAARGIELVHQTSLIEALYSDYLCTFDGAIVDCVLPEGDGFEVAQYLGTFLQNMPTMLVSQSEKAHRRYLRSPKGTVAFVSKMVGAGAILSKFMELLGDKESCEENAFAERSRYATRQ